MNKIWGPKCESTITFMEWQTITSIKGYKVELYAIKYNQHGDKKNTTHFSFNAFQKKKQKNQSFFVSSISFSTRFKFLK